MKIGILKETKNPVDNRVPLTPKQIKMLMVKYPHIEFNVQSSDIRAYSDAEYQREGIEVCENVDDCDFLLGIKEADTSTLKKGKHYMFFGHIAKMQPYNKPLFRALITNKDTFSDYEYLVNNLGHRLVAFGWYAGVVGLYYTLQGWGLRNHTYTLPRPHLKFSLDELIQNLKNVNLGNLKIVVTGNGRVSKGAQYVLQQIGAQQLTPDEFINDSEIKGIVYCVATLENLVSHREGDKGFNREEFSLFPERYHSEFRKFAKTADIFVSCHFWDNKQPVYLSEQDFKEPGFRIKMIGDITCDIQGSIKSTLRSSTHDDPFYDYNPITGNEEKAFTSTNNITIMAVDTCPNALPRETSKYFGENLIKYVLDDLFKSNLQTTPVLDKSTILYQGHLTDRFGYLSEYVQNL